MADTKLASLTATTAPAATDIFYIVVDPGGTPLDRKVTLNNVLTGTLYAATTTDVFAAGVTGDSVKRYVVNADGTLEWGPGDGAVDTNLYRASANSLRTDDSLYVGNTLVVASWGNLVGTLYFGASQDTNLYRSAANTLTTDDALVVVGDLTLSASDIITDTTTGTKIGTATTQKIGFYNATPVVQGAALSDPASPGAIYIQSEVVALRTAILAINDRLRVPGFVAT